NYCRLYRDHPLLDGLEGTELLPVAGQYCIVEAEEGTSVPLRLTHPFIAGPEGLSYTTKPDIGHPMAVTFEHTGGGRSVYLAGQFDKMHWVGGFPDFSRLFANAVLWTLRGDVPAACNAPNTICMSLRLQENRAMVHLVNLTG